jgi:hypothetical protein
MTLSDFNDGCCSNCQIKPSGVVCRPSRGICDKEETCSGVKGDCPPDEFLPDLSRCTTPEGQSAQCASGECMFHSPYSYSFPYINPHSQ